MAPKDSAEQRAANFLMNIFSAPERSRAELLSPLTNIPVVGGMFRRDPADIAAEQARQRGPRVPFLPELGISERLQTQFATPVRATEQAVSAINKAFLPEAAAAPETTQPPSPGLDLSRPRPFAMNPEGQFERYFKTPEMDQYFGAASRGEGAPADAAAMEKLAFEQKAPTDAPLATFYRAQSASGRANMPAIVEGITAGKDAETAKNLKAWAEANPAAAQRLYAKTNVGYGSPRMSSESEAMLKAVGGEQGEFITRQPGPNMPVGDTDVEQYEGERIIEAIQDEKARKSGSVRDRADDFVGNLYSSYMK